MKKTLKLLPLISLLTIVLAGCADTAGGASGGSGNETTIPGSITEETGSIVDYTGWWQSEETTEAVLFNYIEMPQDDTGEVRCYDKNGDMIDTGHTDYNEQRALNGNSLIVFSFSNIGEFGATAAGTTDGERWLDIRFGDKTVSFYYRSESPLNTNETMEVLVAALGDRLNGKKLVEKGEEVIDGITCKIFSLGTDHPENFVAEEHFAISPNGNIYTLDILQGSEWIPYVG